MTDFIRVMVPANTHANLDSLPLRFGIHVKNDTELKLTNCKDLGADSQHAERHHFEASLVDPRDPAKPNQRGHFVVADRYNTGKWTLVTAWRNEVDSEFYLSEALRQLRMDRFLTTEMLLQMHPHYIKGEINSSASLIKFLSGSIAKADLQRFKESELKANKKAEDALAELEKARLEVETAKAEAQRSREVALEAIDVVESLTETNQTLATEKKQTEEELKSVTEENKALKEREQMLLKKEEERALHDNNIATLSAPETLVKVEEDVLVSKSLCTVLTFGDGTKRSMKTISFDKDKSITAKAKTLINKRVRTTCWDPIDEPGKWSRRGYFRNIFQLD